MKKVTAGRDALGDFAPKFAELNDDVLFGEVWSREDKLPARDRSIVTVTALMASGVLDSSLAFHIGEAKKNGVTKEEMAEILTHAAFYAGWPKAWAAFRMAKEIYQDKGGKHYVRKFFVFKSDKTLLWRGVSLFFERGASQIWKNRSVDLWRWFYQEKWYLQSGYEITER